MNFGGKYKQEIAALQRRKTIKWASFIAVIAFIYSSSSFLVNGFTIHSSNKLTTSANKIWRNHDFPSCWGSHSSNAEPEGSMPEPEPQRRRRRRTLPMPTAPSTKPLIEVKRKEIPQDVPIIGDPQKQEDKEYSIDTVLKELAEIQNEGPKRYCILGTRHCSFGHQQIIELLAYALVLSGNHVYTSGAGGTNAAVIRGALRADKPDLLTVILPQSLSKQPEESQELLRKVENLITSPQNDNFEMELAAKLCNSNLLSRTQQLIAFAYHDSDTVINAAKEAMELDILVTICYLD